MDLNQWYNIGISPDTYIETMEQHQENLLHIYDHFSLPADEEFFASEKKKNLRVIVLTEDWCGDAMLNIPILLHIAEVAQIDVRLLHRDKNLELMDEYLTNGKSRSIPIFIFIDKNGNEVAKWGPRASAIQSFVEKSRSELPSKESTDYKVKFDEMILFMTKSYRNRTSFWTDVYQSLKETLQKIEVNQ
nr:thioredoxin family protein [Priestia megaterium]